MRLILSIGHWFFFKPKGSVTNLNLEVTHKTGTWTSTLTPLHESLYSLLHGPLRSILRHSSDLNSFKIHLKIDINTYTHSRRRVWESKVSMQEKFSCCIFQTKEDK